MQFVFSQSKAGLRPLELFGNNNVSIDQKLNQLRFQFRHLFQEKYCIEVCRS